MPYQVEVEPLVNTHSHLREGKILAPLLIGAIQGGAEVLGAQPNTVEGLRCAEHVLRYRHFIHEVRLPDVHMSIPQIIPFVMITEETTQAEIDECVRRGILDAKIYPRFRTTRSENGVRWYFNIMPIVKYCGEVGMRLHWHPEHPWMSIENRDAEYLFLPTVYEMMEQTNATIIWEHGSDSRCIPFWKELATTGRFYVTLTAHHLAVSESAVFGDVSAVCKPPIKTEYDRLGLVQLVDENLPWVIAGGDDAYHPVHAKQPEFGQCACGAFTGPFLLPLYAHALGHLLMPGGWHTTFANFTSRNARRLYGLPDAVRIITLSNTEWQIPSTYPVGDEMGMPFWGGRTLNWKIAD